MKVTKIRISLTYTENSLVWPRKFYDFNLLLASALDCVRDAGTMSSPGCLIGDSYQSIVIVF